MNHQAILADNVSRVQANIAAASVRSGRSEESVKLIAVTKYVDVECCEMLAELGVHDLGESRPQELWRKAAETSLDQHNVRWHFIGHLQRNKARRTAPIASLIHSGDSIRLLRELSDIASQPSSNPVDVLLEVNVSNDATKHGFAPDELRQSCAEVFEMPGVRPRGLMGMAGFTTDSQSARADFSKLRQLRDELQSQAPGGVQLNELSMGMSRDYETAIEEGATMVRVGSTLFEGLE